MTIAVIGHGRSPEGKGWGRKIDCCRRVVRMWDHNWQPWDDYGLRYDYGLYVLTPKQLDIFKRFNTLHPRFGWLAYYGKPTGKEHTWPSPSIVLDNERWAEEAIKLGGIGENGTLTLTRGCAAACWAIEFAKGHDREDVILVGFDNVKLGTNQPIEKSFCPAYWAQYMRRFHPDAQKVYPVNQPKTATHDMAVEKVLLARLASDHGVELKHAEEVW